MDTNLSKTDARKQRKEEQRKKKLEKLKSKAAKVEDQNQETKEQLPATPKAPGEETKTVKEVESIRNVKEESNIKPAVPEEKKTPTEAPPKLKKRESINIKENVRRESMKKEQKKSEEMKREKTRQMVHESVGRQIFSHLEPYKEKHVKDIASEFEKEDIRIHKKVLEVGLEFISGLALGGNSKCIKMLIAFKELIQDYSVPSDRVLRVELVSIVKKHEDFLRKCREFSAGLETAIGLIKEVVTQIPYDAEYKDAKAWIITKIDQFIESRIVGAIEVITEKGANLIQDGDIILTFSRSVSVEAMLKKAFELGKNFRVIIVEGRPDRSARTMMERLCKIGIKCVFTLTQSVTYLIKDVTKVLLGATELMTNGTLVGRVGTAMVACIANSYHKPVIACCETYKFSDRVQFDSLSHNILGNPDYLAYSTVFAEVPGIKKTVLENWQSNSNLMIVNPTYDVTPSEYITMIISEIGDIPPSSVQVAIREVKKYTTIKYGE